MKRLMTTYDPFSDTHARPELLSFRHCLLRLRKQTPPAMFAPAAVLGKLALQALAIVPNGRDGRQEKSRDRVCGPRPNCRPPSRTRRGNRRGTSWTHLLRQKITLKLAGRTANSC